MSSIYQYFTGETLGIYELRATPDPQQLNAGGKDLASRVYNFAKSWFKEAGYLLTMITQAVKERVTGAPAEYVVPSDENNWKEGNRGLYVAVHGLKGHPRIWRNQLERLKQQNENFEIRLPYVPQRGNCRLGDAVDPIEGMVRDYIEQNPERPVCLLGVSNGSRVAMELEVRLRDTKTPIYVSNVAGALSGTKQMNLAQRLKVATLLYNSDIVDEMHYQSDRSKHLLEKVREPLENGVQRVYDFYASPDDFQIKPYTGSLPALEGKRATYFEVPGENHSSIVAKVAAVQTDRCMAWMRQQAR